MKKVKVKERVKALEKLNACVFILCLCLLALGWMKSCQLENKLEENRQAHSEIRLMVLKEKAKTLQALGADIRACCPAQEEQE